MKEKNKVNITNGLDKSMKIEHIKKVIANYEHKLSRVDFWANFRKEKYTKKIDSYKNKLKEITNQNGKEQHQNISSDDGPQEERSSSNEQ